MYFPNKFMCAFYSFRGSEKGPVLVQLLFVGGISDCKRKFLLHLGKAVST